MEVYGGAVADWSKALNLREITKRSQMHTPGQGIKVRWQLEFIVSRPFKNGYILV